MLKYLQQLIDQISTDSSVPIVRPALDKVTAVLMLQLARIDQTVSQEELDVIKNYILSTFSLDQADLDTLIEQALQDAVEATSLYEFTSLIHERCNAQQKYTIVLNLWQIAYADGRLDKYEEHFIRRTAELLYVPHPEFMRAKHEAKQLMENKA